MLRLMRFTPFLVLLEFALAVFGVPLLMVRALMVLHFYSLDASPGM